MTFNTSEPDQGQCPQGEPRKGKVSQASVRKGQAAKPSQTHRDRTKYDRASDKRRQADMPLTDNRED